MSQKLPWSPWYWEDWATATAHLSHVEYSIYHRLLTHYYKTQKPLVANVKQLLNVCLAIGDEEVACLGSVLREFFLLKPDGYHNKRADEEIKLLLTISKQKSDAGRIGGLASASKRQAAVERSLKQSSTHSHIHNTNTPLTPLSGGNGANPLTTRERAKIDKNLQQIGRAMQGADYDPKDALAKACLRAGVEFDRAKGVYLEGDI